MALRRSTIAGFASALIALLASAGAHAAACASVAAGGLWSAQTTWGPGGTGCVGAPGGIPGAADTVTIANFANTVTVAANTAVRSVNIPAGTLSTTLAINPGITLTVGTAGTPGNVTVAMGATNGITKRIDLLANVGNGGRLVINGNLTLTGGNGATRVAQVRLGNHASTALTVNVTGAGPANGDVTLATLGAQLTFSGAGTATIGDTLTIGNSTTVAAGSGTINVGGGFTKTGAASVFTAGTGTVNMNGTIAQAIGGTGTTSFNNLTISNVSNTVAVTPTTNLANVGGTLNMNGAATDLNPAAAVVINSAAPAGTITGTGTVRVTRTGASAYSNQYRFTTNTLAALTVRYFGVGATQAISPIPYGNLRISNVVAAGVTAPTSFDVTGTLTMDATTLLIPAAAVQVNGAAAAGTITGSGTIHVNRITAGTANYATQYRFTTNTLTAMTVIYNGVGATQQISGVSYGNLIIANTFAGGVTAPANFDVSGTLTMNASTLLIPAAGVQVNSAAAAGTITGSGTIHVNRITAGTANYTNQYRFTTNTLTSMTVIYSGVGATQDISGLSYLNLTIANTFAGGLTAPANFNVSGTMTMNATTLLIPAAAVQVNSGGPVGTITGSGTVQVTRTGASAYTNQYLFATNTLGGMTVQYFGVAATQEISPIPYGSLRISNVVAAGVTASANFDVSGTLTMDAGTLLIPAAGVQVNMAAAAGTITGFGTVQVTRVIAATPNYLTQYRFTTHTIGNLTVQYFGVGATQAISALTYGSLKISNVFAAGLSLPAGVNVNGTLTVDANTLLVPVAAAVINALVPAGTITGFGRVQVTRTAATPGYSNQYRFATNTLTDLTVEYVAASAQTISAITYGHLTMSNTSGATLAGDATVDGTLTLSAANISASTFTLISTTGAVTRTSGHIVGKLQKGVATGATSRTFEIGDATIYTPLTIAFGNVTVAGSLVANTTTGAHPDIAAAAIDATQDVNRYWTVTNSGVVFDNYSATYVYDPTDIDGGADPATFGVGKADACDGSTLNCTWTYPTMGGVPTTTTAQATGMTGFSHHVIGRRLTNFLVEASGGGNIGSQTQDVPFTIRITARDSANNTVTSFTGTVVISSGGCTLSGGSGTTANFVNGVLTSHSVTISSTANCDITAIRTGGGAAGTSNSFTVASAVSSFNGCENTATRCSPPTANYDRLFTKLASTAFNLDLVALKTDGTLAATFAGTVAVHLLANAAPTAVGANNCPASQTAVIPLGNSTFSGGRPTAAIGVASGAFSGVAPNYSAYRDVRVRVTCDSTNCPPSGITHCSADNFSVRPLDFTVSSNMTNAGQTGAPGVAAGADFTLTSTAVAGYAGAPTLDRTVGGQKVVTHVGVADYTDRLRDTAGGGTITFPAAPIATGVSTATVQYHDAGNVRILANGILDSSFSSVDTAGTDCVAGSSSNSDDDSDATNGLKYGCNVANQSNSSLFGRFFPSHYVMSSGTVTAACAAGGFSYMGHAAMGLTYTISAMSMDNPGGATLKLSKYTALYGTLAPVNVLSEDGTVGTDLTGNLSPSLAYSAANWSAGDYAVSGGTYSFARATPTGPYDSFYIGAGITDADGAVLGGLDFKLGDPTCTVACTHKKLSASPTKIRFGRLRLLNSMGAENLNLPIPLRAEYWTGSGFMTNDADSCTTLAPSPAKKFVLYGHQGGIGTGNMVTPTAGSDGNVSTTGTFTAGVGSLTLLKPSPAPTTPGSVRVCLDLDSGAAGDTTCQAVAPANLTHLQGNWAAGGTYDKDPNSRSSFGLYGAKPRQFIFFREIY